VVPVRVRASLVPAGAFVKSPSPPLGARSLLSFCAQRAGRQTDIVVRDLATDRHACLYTTFPDLGTDILQRRQPSPLIPAPSPQTQPRPGCRPCRRGARACQHGRRGRSGRGVGAERAAFDPQRRVGNTRCAVAILAVGGPPGHGLAGGSLPSTTRLGSLFGCVVMFPASHAYSSLLIQKDSARSMVCAFVSGP
jgi:hypothetical protein